MDEHIKEKYDKKFKEIYEGLNTHQREAVDAIEGPVMVVAGPGTGKTQILSARIGNILRQTDVYPQNILCLTYTDAGTIAMRKRLLEFIGPAAYNVHIYTFHAFCNQVIQENLDYFGIRDLQPVSEIEKVEILYEIIDELPVDNPLKRLRGDKYYDKKGFEDLFDVMKRENWSAEDIRKGVDEYLDSLKDNEDFYYKRKSGNNNAGDFNENKYQKEVDKFTKVKHAAQQFENYENKLLQRKRYDYNDMILWVIKAFKESRFILRRYQEQYQYFLVDEYQDTNGAQNEVLRMLSSYWDVPNLFVVGDDDQSIFRFQGASVKNILDFHLQYKEDVKHIVLEDNYRSSQHILDAANAAIAYNEERLIHKIEGLSKKLTARGSFAEEAKKPVLREYFNAMHEEAHIVKELEEAYRAGEDLQEIAIIYRGHAQIAGITQLLEEKGIPFNARQRVNIFHEPLIKKLLVILSYIDQEFKKPDSAEYLLFELMHYDFFDIALHDITKLSKELSRARKTEKKSWREMIASKQRMLQLGLVSAGKISSLEANLTYWIKEKANYTIQVLLEKIITRGNVLEKLMHRKDKVWQMQLLTTFFNFIKEETAKAPDMDLTKLLKTVEQMMKNRIALPANKVSFSEKGVQLVTAHSSKGLEFEKVYLIGASKDKWEGKRKPPGGFAMPETLVSASTENNLEEERRLFFVAMTRAKKELIITHAAQTLEEKELEKSQFITELEEDFPLTHEYITLSEEEMLYHSFNLLKDKQVKAGELIDHDLVDEVMKHFKMSVTSLNKYMKCPLSFYFENVLRVPTARSAAMGFGSAVHYALEQFFKAMLKDKDKQFMSEKGLLKLFMEGLEKYRSHFTDEEYEDKVQYAEVLLPEYYKEYIDKWSKVVVLEYDITNAQVDGIPVSGKLDKLEFDGNMVNVVDYKTGNPDNSKTKLYGASEKYPEGNDYWRQIVFYKILMDADKKRPWEMISGEMDYLERNRKDEFVKAKIVVKPSDTDLVIKQIKEAYTGMNEHHFDGCGEDTCQWCNFVQDNFESTKLELKEEEE